VRSLGSERRAENPHAEAPVRWVWGLLQTTTIFKLPSESLV
jgi:hypothetical protein